MSETPMSPACAACREPGGTCFPGPCKRYAARKVVVTHPADIAYGGHEEDGEHKIGEHRCPAILRGTRLVGRCTWPACKDANGVCAYSPLPAQTPRRRAYEDGQDWLGHQSGPDPIAALVHLRAAMVRIANEVDALADLPSIREIRGRAPALAEKIRNMAMAREMVSASARVAS